MISFTVLYNNGPAKITVGTPIKIPYTNVNPMSALNNTEIAVGPGCGGKKPCVTDKAATIGIPTSNNGISADLAIVKIKGINKTKPIS